MLVKEKGGEISASVAETNRIRLSLGLKPLAGTDAAKAAAAAEAEGAAIDSSMGPQLPQKQKSAAEEEESGNTGGAGKKTAKGPRDEKEGAEEVLAISLEKYTKATPVW